MEPRYQIGAGPHVSSGEYRLSVDSISAPTLDMHADGTTTSLSGLDLPVGSVSFWLSTIRSMSVWEAVLIVILFTLITGLVGVRVAELLSNRDLEVAPSRLRAENPGTPDSAQSDGSDADGSRTDHPRSYEHVVSVDTPPELLSDEGRIVQLLVQNGGQIRQHRIADETGWSKSKVSRMLSSMCDDGTVEKNTVGRENIISLPEARTGEPHWSADADNPVP